MRARTLKASDAGDAAHLHREAFPEFFLTSLGPEFLTSFYEFAAISRSAITLILESDDGSLVGVAIGYTNSRKHYLSFLRTKAASLARYIVFKAPSRGQLISRFVRSLNLGTVYEPPAPPSGVLLASIAVAPHAPPGSGSVLICAFEREVAKRRLSQVFLTTDAVCNDHALAFYRKNGYSPAIFFETTEHRQMIQLRKTLAAA